MKELINISCKYLNVRVDEEHLYCEVKNECEIKISKKLILVVVKWVYNKIEEYKKIR